MVIKVSCLSPIEVPLVNKFYKEHKARGTAKRSEQVWVARQAVIHKKGGIMAACRYQTVGEQLLLVGVMVADEARNQGVGKQLITQSVTQVITTQKKAVYTFPYRTLQSWYEQLGFTLVNLADDSEVCDEIKGKLAVYIGQGRDLLAMCIK